MIRARSIATVAFPVLLSVAAALLWVRSYWKMDQIGCYGPARSVVCCSWGGVLEFTIAPTYIGSRPYSPPPKATQWSYMTERLSDFGGPAFKIARYRQLAWLGFAYSPNYLIGNYLGLYYSGYRVYVPHCFIILLILSPLLLNLAKQRKRRHLLAAGRCPNCEYDLRASKQRCPECGSAIGAPNR
jgi:hypothetical protein